MAIWFTDTNLTTIAQHQHDRRLSGSITEMMQILSNVYRRLYGSRGVVGGESYPLVVHHLGEHNASPVIYKFRSVNDPLENWVMESKLNYRMLNHLLLVMHDEYHFRFGEYHPSYQKRHDVKVVPPTLPSKSLTLLPKSDVINDESIVESYRKEARTKFTSSQTWTCRNVPEFLYYELK